MLCREQFRFIPKLHSLLKSGFPRIYRRYILPPILYFVFIVDFIATMCRYSLFATAEFIIDDWHRFLGNISELPCWSVHCSLSAHLLSVVIPPMIALYRFPIPQIFIFRFTTLCSFLYLDCGYSVCFLATTFYPWRYTSEYLCNTNFCTDFDNCSRLWRYNKFTERS